jgi:hypothetical protein
MKNEIWFKELEFNALAKEEHRLWKKNSPRLDRQSLTEIFDISIIQQIKLHRRYLRGLLEVVYDKYGILSGMPLKCWFVQWQRQRYRGKIQEIKKQLSFTTKKNFEKKDFDLIRIKQYPIRDILAQRGIEVIGEFFKLRDEKTPSCKIYDEDNRWHDFGSNQGGDSIDLIQELDGCNFQQACKSVT